MATVSAIGMAPSAMRARARWRKHVRKHAVARAATPQSPRGIDNPACNLAIGQRVVIRPRGASSDPDITGQLRFMDMTRLSIDHESDETGAVAVHLPLAGYVVRAG